jgi:hypothetical protein
MLMTQEGPACNRKVGAFFVSLKTADGSAVDAVAYRNSAS